MKDLKFYRAAAMYYGIILTLILLVLIINTIAEARR